MHRDNYLFRQCRGYSDDCTAISSSLAASSGGACRLTSTISACGRQQSGVYYNTRNPAELASGLPAPWRR
jgi:hypothetical protein